MSTRVQELAERESTLQLRCAAQRSALGEEVDLIQARLEPVEHAFVVGRRILLNPVTIGVGVLGLVLLGRARSFRMLSNALLLAGAMRRLLRIGSSVAPRRAARSAREEGST
jgi:hypothetical protein